MMLRYINTQGNSYMTDPVNMKTKLSCLNKLGVSNIVENLGLKIILL